MEDKIKQDLKIQADKFVSVFKRLPGFNVEENSEVFYEMLWHCVVIGSQLTAERAKEKVEKIKKKNKLGHGGACVTSEAIIMAEYTAKRETIIEILQAIEESVIK